MRPIVGEAARDCATLDGIEQPDRASTLVGREIVAAQGVGDEFAVRRDRRLREAPQAEEILNVERRCAGRGEQPGEAGQRVRETRRDPIIPGAKDVHGLKFSRPRRIVSPPRILSFDLDDTLWPVAPVIAQAERELFRWLQDRYPAAVHEHSIDSMRALRERVAGRFPQHGHDLSFLRRQALAEQFLAAGHHESLADRALEVFLEARNRVEFYPDVRPALERLRGRYRLFALSNGNADLERCGIAEFFDGHVTARAAGAAKPDARIFDMLRATAGAAAHEVLHVGDDPLADVLGAQRAGMRSVWLNRDARAWPPHLAPPPRIVTTLSELD